MREMSYDDIKKQIQFSPVNVSSIVGSPSFWYFKLYMYAGGDPKAYTDRMVKGASAAYHMGTNFNVTTAQRTKSLNSYYSKNIGQHLLKDLYEPT